MKNLILTFASMVLGAAAAEAQQPNVGGRRLSQEDVRAVAPALEAYTQQNLYGDVWNRPGLSKRDRSLVTIAVLIARNQSMPLTYYIGQALDNGVQPSEISEIITHLAFYSGWANAFAAIGPARDIFAQRGIGPDQLLPVTGPKLPLNEAQKADRATRVQESAGPISPSLVNDTTNMLFRDL